MLNPAVVVAAVAGGLLCGLLGWLASALRARSKRATLEAEAAALAERLSAAERDARAREADAARLDEDLRAMRAEVLGLGTRLAESQTTLMKERESFAEKMAAVREAEAKLTQTFNALAADALKSNNQAFLDLARESLATFHEGAKGDLVRRHEAIAGLVNPVREALGKFEEKVQALEQARTGAYHGLMEQVTMLRDGQSRLQTETANLVTALRAPQVRGRWGEMQLRRVVDLAGMLEHCDFVEQETRSGEDGRLRPDLIVRLPGDKTLVVDAKAPLAAYLESIEATDETARRDRMTHHARQIREHVRQLASKAYWNQFQPTPEFVVLFLPGETFFSAALLQDANLLDNAVEAGVILATPMTLIALLKSAAYGWRQERLAENAEEISRLGKELHDRLAKLATVWSNVGKSLGSAVAAYNEATGSLESRVLVTGRRFRDLSAAGGAADLPTPAPVDAQPRQLQAPEMAPGNGDGRGET
jgi:DNA recombination protein RmuC